MISLIRFVIMLIVLFCWSVIGFLLWIPFLVRMIAMITSLFIASTFNNIDLMPAKNRLEFAIAFYSQGFSLIINTLKTPGSHRSDMNIDHQETKNAFTALFANLPWTIVFWLSVVFFWYKIVN